MGLTQVLIQSLYVYRSRAQRIGVRKIAEIAELFQGF
jgi:hypothetical protein